MSGDESLLDDLAQAIGDVTRRRIIEHLDGSPGATTAELVELIPTMTRFGVMKHIDVLRRSALVRTMDDGRWRRHYLEASPLAALQRWLAALSVQPEASGPEAAASRRRRGSAGTNRG